MSVEIDPTRYVDEWPLPGLSAVHRTKIKADLLKAHAAFLRSNRFDVYSYVAPMQQAFNGIASVLFDANLLTEEILNNQVRLFVIESANAGKWLYFASTSDAGRIEIFPGYLGDKDVWGRFNKTLYMLFKAEIAEWTSKLLEREASESDGARRQASLSANTPPVPSRREFVTRILENKGWSILD